MNLSSYPCLDLEWIILSGSAYPQHDHLCSEISSLFSRVGSIAFSTFGLARFVVGLCNLLLVSSTLSLAERFLRNWVWIEWFGQRCEVDMGLGSFLALLDTCIWLGNHFLKNLFCFGNLHLE